MTEFKDQIPAAGGVIEFIYDAQRGMAVRLSSFQAVYCVAVSMDGRHLLDIVSPGGLGQTMVYPKPSVLAYIQSDQLGMWGRKCPLCEKYFRTNHVAGITVCPYCSEPAPSLAFISKEQLTYITAFYDAYARACLGKTTTTLSMSAITDQTPAWHYSEEKQQFHFTCDTKDCHAATDILGQYGYCPRCGRTNARKLFTERMDNMISRLEETKKTISDRQQREAVWEEMTVKSLSEFEALAKHLRRKLLCVPMTSNRRKEVENLNFQKPLQADELLVRWFDIGLLEWPGNGIIPRRIVPPSEVPFIKKMIQRRHILMHNDGLVDQEYLDLSGEANVRLDERIRIRSHEVRRFIENIRGMAAIFWDNVEYRFEKG
jgi:Zn finger protein HypA/HybF involved in hydrogenase expression